jgi:hypothetical protein
MYKIVDYAINKNGISLSDLDPDESMIAKELYAKSFISGYIKSVEKIVSSSCISIRLRGTQKYDKTHPWPYYLANIHFSRHRNFANVMFGGMAAPLAGSGNIAIFKKYDGYWQYYKTIGNWIS